MIKTRIIQQVIDEDNTYEIGDRVRVKMKPRDENHPQNANEYIGEIIRITDTLIIVDVGIDIRDLVVCNIDKMRFAAADESFENTWEF